LYKKLQREKNPLGRRSHFPMLRLSVLHNKGNSSMMNPLDMKIEAKVVAKNSLEAGGVKITR